MLTTKYLLLIIFYTKFQIPLFFKKKIKFFLFFYEKVLTLSFTFGIVSFVAREKIKNPVKCDMRKCRNWQTSKTKDLVSIALVWVQVPSSALKNEELCEFMVPYFLLLFRIPSATGPPVRGGLCSIESCAFIGLA